MYTIEFYPEEGKYHYDGHRDCKINLDPTESNKIDNICPVCHRKLTVGVLNRVEKLADRSVGEAKKFGIIPFKSLMPLKEIIANLYNLKSASKRIDTLYDSLVDKFGSEFNVLLDTSLEELTKAGFEEIGHCIENVRKGEVVKIPGYDGEYGIIKIKDIKQPINTKLWSL
jgi:PHP family Zn ribbon phosphoesterase